ncbi:MAG: hypothetical protein E6R07_10670 [Nevskiaceae bacterium]|nr:MAG: hypothetical protein E6R07_10670 [Nevskiaceae bacterium]
MRQKIKTAQAAQCAVNGPKVLSRQAPACLANNSAKKDFEREWVEFLSFNTAVVRSFRRGYDARSLCAHENENCKNALAARAAATQQCPAAAASKPETLPGSMMDETSS